MCVAQSAVCGRWVVSGAPNKIRMTVRSGAARVIVRARERREDCLIMARLS